MRLAPILGLAGIVHAQSIPPQAYRLVYGIPIDPVSLTLADADGFVSRTADLSATTRLAPGMFFTVSIQFTQGSQIGVVCNLPPVTSVLALILSDGSSRTIPLKTLPAGMSRGAGCDPFGAVFPYDVPLGSARLLFSYALPPVIIISAEAPVEIVSSAPLLFTAQDQQLTHPYLSGQLTALSMTGLGLTPVENMVVDIGAPPRPLYRERRIRTIRASNLCTTGCRTKRRRDVTCRFICAPMLTKRRPFLCPRRISPAPAPTPRISIQPLSPHSTGGPNSDWFHHARLVFQRRRDAGIHALSTLRSLDHRGAGVAGGYTRLPFSQRPHYCRAPGLVHSPASGSRPVSGSCFSSRKLA